MPTVIVLNFKNNLTVQYYFCLLDLKIEHLKMYMINSPEVNYS